MRNAILGAVVGIVLAVFATLFYVNAVATVVNLNSRVTAVENFLNKQIEMAQKAQPQMIGKPKEVAAVVEPKE